jgi:hypothetical protein
MTRPSRSNMFAVSGQLAHIAASRTHGGEILNSFPEMLRIEGVRDV